LLGCNAHECAGRQLFGLVMHPLYSQTYVCLL